MSRTPTRAVRRGRFTRREVLHLAQAAAAGLAVGGLVVTGGEAKAEERRGVCRICTMHCGIVASLEGGRLARVEGDRASNTAGFLCEHGRALPEVVHARERVRRPLLRAGHELVEVSWDDALEELAVRLHAIAARHGPEALVVQTGWPFVRHPLVPLLRRFCHAFGTPNLTTVAAFCESAGRIGRALVTGSRLRPDLSKARTLLVWGANPPVSSPPFAHVAHAFAGRGKTLIVVDTIRTELAARATLHLRPRPGTDGALALGLLQVVIAERRWDERVVREETHGFDELAARVAAFTPEKVEALTTVPAADVVQAARLYAAGPAATWEGLGVEHHRGGVSTVHALSCLAAICGHVGVPGGEVAVDEVDPDDPSIPVLPSPRTQEPLPGAPEAKALGADEYPIHVLFNRQAQGNLLADAVLDDRPYPVRALVSFGANPYVTHPGATRTAAALDRLELLVSIDPFLHATGERADLVLPAATFVEGEVLGEDDRRVARSAVLPPRGEARTDYDVLAGLASALGLGRWFPWRTLGEALDAPTVPWPGGGEIVARAPGARWPTPTGKLELASTVLERHGLDPLPRYAPPPSDPGRPLLLVSGPRTRAFLNSQFRTVPAIAAHAPPRTFRLHPDAAAAAGIADGTLVRVTTRHGSVVLPARVDDAVHPEAVVVPAGDASPSVNLPPAAGDLEPASGSPSFRSEPCRIAPA